MPESTPYYLGRVIKIGSLTSEMVVEAILNPTPVTWWASGWSFFDARRYRTRGVDYICARLSKFNPEGEVIIADPGTKKEATRQEPNLRIASSYFIYIPEVSGIAFTKVYDHIEEVHFIYRFRQIVEATYLGFFVECDIKLITDLRSFAEKLKALEGIYRISAKLNPPNPLFGPLWKELKEYIEKRRADQMFIREEAQGSEPLNTDLPNEVKRAAEQTTQQPYIPSEPLPIGDAAILMAADGYGSGHVTGRRGGEKITIKTSETIRNFDFDREPEPAALFEIAYAAFKQIEEERHMEH